MCCVRKKNSMVLSLLYVLLPHGRHCAANNISPPENEQLRTMIIIFKINYVYFSNTDTTQMRIKDFPEVLCQPQRGGEPSLFGQNFLKTAASTDICMVLNFIKLSYSLPLNF